MQQQLLRLVRPAGAVVVVGPQDVAHLDARKVLGLLGEARVPVLGGMDAAVAAAGDAGRPLLLAHPTSRPARALREVASHLTAALDADAGD